jgi:hypothetical protein
LSAVVSHSSPKTGEEWATRAFVAGAVSWSFLSNSPTPSRLLGMKILLEIGEVLEHYSSVTQPSAALFTQRMYLARVPRSAL